MADEFVRPVHKAYRHLVCDEVMHLSTTKAEQLAKDPTAYSVAFCTQCKEYAAIGPMGEFAWIEEAAPFDPDNKVGT